MRHTTINLAIRPKRRSSKRSRRRARTAAIGLAVLTIAGLAPALSTPTLAAAATFKANDTEPNPVGFTTHQGRWLVDSTGRVEVPHGMNMVEKSAPYYPGPQADGFGADDAAYLASQGYTYVRLGIEMNALEPTPGHIDNAYLNHLASTVATLSHDHIQVLLDFHQDEFSAEFTGDGFPNWMAITHGAHNNTAATFPLSYIENPAVKAAFDSFWADDKGPDGIGLQEYYTGMAKAVAKRFADNTDVIGYDVLNEPFPGTDWSTCPTATGCPAVVDKELVPFYKKALAAIRSEDPHHMVFFEPFVIDELGPYPVSLPSFGPNTGLSFHQYTPVTSLGSQPLTEAVDWSKQTGGALLETEWGASTSASALVTQAQQLDAQLLPWSFWAYNEEVNTDMKAPISQPGAINHAVVAALDEPTATVVAGTPTSITFDNAVGIFTLHYSTDRPGGGTFPTGAVTAIRVPLQTYQGGYTVTVTGGSQTSKPCADTVTIVASPHAGSVAVTVAPGGTCHMAS